MAKLVKNHKQFSQHLVSSDFAIVTTIVEPEQLWASLLLLKDPSSVSDVYHQSNLILSKLNKQKIAICCHEWGNEGGTAFIQFVNWSLRALERRCTICCAFNIWKARKQETAYQPILGLGHAILVHSCCKCCFCMLNRSVHIIFIVVVKSSCAFCDIMIDILCSRTKIPRGYSK